MVRQKATHFQIAFPNNLHFQIFGTYEYISHLNLVEYVLVGRVQIIYALIQREYRIIFSSFSTTAQRNSPRIIHIRTSFPSWLSCERQWPSNPPFYANFSLNNVVTHTLYQSEKRIYRIVHLRRKSHQFLYSTRVVYPFRQLPHPRRPSLQAKLPIKSSSAIFPSTTIFFRNRLALYWENTIFDNKRYNPGARLIFHPAKTDSHSTTIEAGKTNF